MLPRLMSVRDAALALNVPASTVYHWATHGTLPSVKIGGRRMILVEGVKGAMLGEAA
jgi:excisionase family DNA binding protein